MIPTISNIPIFELEKILMSDSVCTALRFAYKNPSKSGVDECEDSCYQDLYEMIMESHALVKLKKDHEQELLDALK